MAGVTILDGGMGRQLKAMGAPFEQPEWSALALMKAPEYVTKAHHQFIDAGATVITTNNYAVVPFHIGEQRFQTLGDELTQLAGRLAREAADTANVKVAGSLPPLFGSYRPDLFQADGAVDLYKGIVGNLNATVDVWLAETISSVDEALAIQAALHGTQQPFWLSFTLSDDVIDGHAVLRSDESISQVVNTLTKSDGKTVDAILFNCSQPEMITLALAELQQCCAERGLTLQSGGYGNAFTPRGKQAEANSDVAEMRDEITPQLYAEVVGDWINSGANLVGGCCGIGPEHIAELSARYVS